jgi:hypothetical protein
VYRHAPLTSEHRFYVEIGTIRGPICKNYLVHRLAYFVINAGLLGVIFAGQT